VAVTLRELTLEDVLPLRRTLLRPGQAPEAAIHPGDAAPATVHLGAFIEEELVCVATLFREAPAGQDDPLAWRLVGMATRPDRQRRGYGRAVIERCVAAVAGRGGTRLWCNARLDAVGFYQRLGFVAIGPPFEVAGTGLRQRMVRPVAPPSQRPGAEPFAALTPAREPR
jgi:GNAT superfamily N-acetyltransferase